MGTKLPHYTRMWRSSLTNGVFGQLPHKVVRQFGLPVLAVNLNDLFSGLVCKTRNPIFKPQQMYIVLLKQKILCTGYSSMFSRAAGWKPNTVPLILTGDTAAQKQLLLCRYMISLSLNLTSDMLLEQVDRCFYAIYLKRWQGKEEFSVKSSRSAQSWIDRVQSVGSTNNHNLSTAVQAVHECQ